MFSSNYVCIYRLTNPLGRMMPDWRREVCQGRTQHLSAVSPKLTFSSAAPTACFRWTVCRTHRVTCTNAASTWTLLQGVISRLVRSVRWGNTAPQGLTPTTWIGSVLLYTLGTHPPLPTPLKIWQKSPGPVRAPRHKTNSFYYKMTTLPKCWQNLPWSRKGPHSRN